MKSLTILSASILPLLASCQAFQSKANTANDGKPKETAESQMVEDLAAAQCLARWGRQNNNALVLAAAAAVMKQTPTDGTAPVSSTPAAEKATKEGKGATTADSLLAEARTMAGSDQALLAAIARAGESTRGRVGGPGSTTSVLKGRMEEMYIIEFRGGESARVTVDGDGDSDLDLFVYDENDNLVDSDDDSTDYCIARWRPRWTGKFKILVQNVGTNSNLYTITTN